MVAGKSSPVLCRFDRSFGAERDQRSARRLRTSEAAWLIFQGVREHRGVAFMAAGIVALGAHSFVATMQPVANFGRILAAYGGILAAGSLLGAMVADGLRPDRYDIWGAGICLVGVAIIMYAPRARALEE